MTEPANQDGTQTKKHKVSSRLVTTLSAGKDHDGGASRGLDRRAQRTGANTSEVDWTAPGQVEPRSAAGGRDAQTTSSPIRGPAGRGNAAVDPAWRTRGVLTASPPALPNAPWSESRDCSMTKSAGEVG